MMEDIEIIRSDRRTIAIEIKNDCKVVVRAPLEMSRRDIDQFLRDKNDWIEKHLEIAKERQVAAKDVFTDEQIRELRDAAAKDIPQRVERFAPVVGVTVGKVVVRKQKTCWGSCSGKGNVSFNCLLMLCPEQVRDYVVVHELCHRKELSHSARFWSEVEMILPDYRVWRKWLKDHGREIIGRL